MVFFILIQILIETFCKKTVAILIGCHILWRLIGVGTVCPTKRMLGLYGFMMSEYELEDIFQYLTKKNNQYNSKRPHIICEHVRFNKIFF